ncbi:glycoside hydrolase family 125 protein [Pendulispora brunnea]|uniref:Glycoside hydrolase family 125 protein n=1 Tax=Pendulispora brunnea TaxID=2905690 RepID=A0ABZ2KB82_9BACT
MTTTTTQDRRSFLKLGGFAAVASAAGCAENASSESTSISLAAVAARYDPKPVEPGPDGSYPSQRPPVGERRFVSQAVEDVIAKVKPRIRNRKLAWMFENCFPNTLDTTVFYSENGGTPDTFVITGDIEAMWQRDSSAQVWPYLPFVTEDEPLRKLISGVIRRHTKNILLDPYANAFNNGPTGGPWQSDLTDMKLELWERKYEIDSLCYPVRLAHEYWKITGDTSPFDSAWQKAATAIVSTLRAQQRKTSKGPYHFQRNTPTATDTAPGRGYGNPIKPVGLICSIFRPSDDATIYPFLIPANLFAVVALKQVSEIANEVLHDTALASSAWDLALEVERAVRRHAIALHERFGPMYAYEVDGFGNRLFMDDSNVPSLLALPYLGAVDARDGLYRATRQFALSTHNPYFFQGAAGEGIGGPHVGLDYIWPMAIIMRGLTSDDEGEIKTALDTLVRTDASTGVMHEAFHKDNANDFTRSWFAWGNTLFGEFVLKIAKERPHLL